MAEMEKILQEARENPKAIKTQAMALIGGKSSLISLAISLDALDTKTLQEQYQQLCGMKRLAEKIGIPKADIDAVTKFTDEAILEYVS